MAMSEDDTSPERETLTAQVPRNEYEAAQQAATAAGETLNEYVRKAVRQRIARDAGAKLLDALSDGLNAERPRHGQLLWKPAH